MEGKQEDPLNPIDADGNPIKLSVGQKKKIKEKMKKEADAKAKADAAASGDAPVEEAKPAAGGKKKGKGNAMAELAREKQRLMAEAQAAANADQIAAEAEEKRIQEEKDKLAAIEKAKNDESKKAERDKKQKLKDEGKWLTPAQLKKKRAEDEKRADLIARGIIKEGEEEEDDGKKKSNMVKRNKNKDKRNKPQQQEEKNEDQKQEEDKSDQIDSSKPAEVKKQNKQETKKAVQKEESEEDDAVDDWETADLDEIVDKVKVQKVADIVNDAEDEDNTMEALKQGEVQKSIKQAANDKGGVAVKGTANKKEVVSADIFAGEDEAAKQDRLDRKAANAKRLAELRQKKSKTGGERKLRCPIVCILGHVDTGKTKILDKLRKTNVQAGEAGGITQQIGATYFPQDYILSHIDRVKGRMEIDLKIPGFLVIDTPGHESFTNLRSRGSSLCDIAILVVDLMHGLEQQTLESIELLRQKKCPFIVALNKIDRCYQWKSEEYRNFRDAIEKQETHTVAEYEDRLGKTIVAFAEQGFNSCVYYENNDIEEYLSFVPTSAITGEGLPDLMTYLCQQCQERIPKQLAEKDEFECTVLEVKVIEGLGTTIDVVLVNGLLKVEDTIVLQGFNGAIVTKIRALLTPYPMKEMRVKGEYVHHQKIKGAMGIKISAPGLENAMAGAELLVAKNEHEIQLARKEIEDNMYDILDKYVDKTQDGVCVQASTLGSMEALLEFLKTSKISVCSISIGPVHKKDVLKAMKVLAQENESKIRKEYATILAFDVRVTPEAQAFAEQEGIKVFTAKIIYHLFDDFTAYVKQCVDDRKEGGGGNAIFPCALEIVKDAVFNRGNPIIIGVQVTAGMLKIGTPLCVPEKENLRIGVVESIELNKKSVNVVRPKDGQVAVRIGGQQHVLFGRHFDDTNQICSWQTRRSIDALKEYYREELSMEDWKLVKALKQKFKIE